MNGFLFIDKKKRMTSFDVIRILKKKFKGVKIGHSGTLDPIATGLLVVGLGEATKLLEFLLGKDKTYEAEAVLGKISDTFDADGVIEDMVQNAVISLEMIKKIVQQKFTGEIEQFPPKFSAKKINGKRAYDLARKGEEVSLKSSKITIRSFKIISFKWPILKFLVTGSSGMYVRSLIHDLGQEVECGAYMSNLRRIKIGNLSVDEAKKVDDVAEMGGVVHSSEEVFADFPSIKLGDEDFRVLTFGQFVLNKKNVQENVFLGKYKEKIVSVLELAEGGKFIKMKKKLNVY